MILSVVEAAVCRINNWHAITLTLKELSNTY